jgi:hypothetical protein
VISKNDIKAYVPVYYVTSVREKERRSWILPLL